MWPINRSGHGSADVEATPASREAHVRRPAVGNLPDQLEPAAIPADPRRARHPWSGQMCPIDLEGTFRRRIEATGAAREAHVAGARREICPINSNGQQSPQTRPEHVRRDPGRCAQSTLEGTTPPAHHRARRRGRRSFCPFKLNGQHSAESTWAGPGRNLPVQVERAGIRGGRGREIAPPSTAHFRGQATGAEFRGALVRTPPRSGRRGGGSGGAGGCRRCGGPRRGGARGSGPRAPSTGRASWRLAGR